MGVSTWTSEQDETILNGLKADKTYSQIATSLGVSRAMVSGRLRRLRKIRPDDVPQIGFRKTIQKSAYGRIAMGQGLTSDEIDARKQRTMKRSAKRDVKNAKKRAIALPKPDNAPVAFIDLKPGQCSWSDDDEAGAQMSCCAAPVLDPKKREGDRRSSHCAYHFHLSLAPDE